MKRQHLFAILSFTMLFLSSCNRYYYKPNAVNTPLFTDGGQAHFNLAGSVGSGDDGDYNGTSYFFDVQAAYSPINHLAFISNYSTYSFKPESPDTLNHNINASAHLLEGGVGGYWASKGRRFQFVTDFFAGYGAGPIKSDVNMNARRFFVQPGLGLHSPWFDFSFNLRVSFLKYANFDARGNTDDYLKSQGLIDYYGARIDAHTYTFFEPTFTIKAGYKFAKVQLQAVLSQNVNSVPWKYSPVRFTAGFYFSLEDALHLDSK